MLFKSIGRRKTEELIEIIRERVNSMDSEIFKNQIDVIKYILKETDELVQYGEWFVGFENMLSNLDEYRIEMTSKEVNLMKEIFTSINRVVVLRESMS